jgi:hypothetical protein
LQRWHPKPSPVSVHRLSQPFDGLLRVLATQCL